MPWHECTAPLDHNHARNHSRLSVTETVKPHTRLPAPKRTDIERGREEYDLMSVLSSHRDPGMLAAHGWVPRALCAHDERHRSASHATDARRSRGDVRLSTA